MFNVVFFIDEWTFIPIIQCQTSTKTKTQSRTRIGFEMLQNNNKKLVIGGNDDDDDDDDEPTSKYLSFRCRNHLSSLVVLDLSFGLCVCVCVCVCAMCCKRAGAMH